MTPQPHRWLMPQVSLITLVTTIVTLAIFGCGKDTPTGTGGGGGGGGGAGSTSYRGTVSGDGISGTITLTIATATPAPQPGPARARGTVTASGTLEMDGASLVNLTGTYDDVANTIAMTGGGLSLAGILVGTYIKGTITDPNAGDFDFSVLANGTGANAVIVVTGTYVSNVAANPGGQFNFSILGTVLYGTLFEDGSTSGGVHFVGTYDPNTGDISIPDPTDPNASPFASGTLTGEGASGLYDDGQGESGTWSGTRQ